MNNFEDETENKLKSIFDGIEAREQPKQAAYDTAFEATHKQWQIDQARREAQHKAQRRKIQLRAIAACLVVGVINLVVWQTNVQDGIESNADQWALDFTSGQVLIEQDGTENQIDEAKQLQVSSNTHITAITAIRTVTEDGVDIRLAKNTKITWIDSRSIKLTRGSMYVSTNGGGGLSIQTDYGMVRDIGTEFVVSSNPQGLEVAVREGQVELESEHGLYLSQANDTQESQVIQVTNGELNHHTESANDERWQWIDEAPKGYHSNQPLEILKEIAKDKRKMLSFKSPGVRVSLSSERLSGDFSHLSPDAALALLVASTGLVVEQDGETIRISFPE